MKTEKHKLSKDARKLKRRIKRTRAKAGWVGFFYLIGTILLAALACIPMVAVDGVKLGVGIIGEEGFWTGFDFENILSAGNIGGLLYALMLLAVVINVFRSFGKLGWLWNRKASKTYGYDRNVLAMQSMGKIFSGSLSCIITFNVLIVLLCSGSAVTAKEVLAAPSVMDKFLGMPEVAGFTIYNIYLVLAIGLLLHFWLGFWGGKVSFFPIEEGVGVIEKKRAVGRFAALFRNILQAAAAIAIVYFLIPVSSIGAFIAPYIGGAEFTGDMIQAVLQLVILLCWLVLIKHATATTEYNLEGAEGPGMANFRVFIFFTLAASAALYFMAYSSDLFNFDDAANKSTLFIVAISLVMFIIECMMRKAPGLPREKEEAEVSEDEEGVEGGAAPVKETDDLDFDFFLINGYVTDEVIETVDVLADPEL